MMKQKFTPWIAKFTKRSKKKLRRLCELRWSTCTCAACVEQDQIRTDHSLSVVLSNLQSVSAISVDLFQPSLRPAHDHRMGVITTTNFRKWNQWLKYRFAGPTMSDKAASWVLIVNKSVGIVTVVRCFTHILATSEIYFNYLQKRKQVEESLKLPSTIHVFNMFVHSAERNSSQNKKLHVK